MMSILCICSQCGKEYEVKNYRKDTSKFCSYECMYESKKGIIPEKWIEKICPSCGQTFSCLKSKERKYCSSECAHNKLEKYTTCICNVCGKEFSLLKSRYKKYLSGKQKTITCSRECSNSIKHTGKIISCTNCGKEFYRRQQHIERSDNSFCSVKCEFDYKHKQCYEIRQCDVCKTSFEVLKKSTKRFCSPSCQNEWQKSIPKTERANFKGIKIKCDYCSSDYFISPYKINSSNNHFCSKECRKSWFAEVWSQQDDVRERSRDVALKLLSENKFSYTNSKPQQIVDEILKELNVDFEREYNIKYFSVDNYLPKFNLMIEVQGDYWHCNPIIYCNNLYKIQKQRIARDKAKHTYVLNNYNIEILYLWEKDIYTQRKMCKQLIEKYIETKGVLSDYNSFNYSLTADGNIIENVCKIIPYQDKDITSYK